MRAVLFLALIAGLCLSAVLARDCYVGEMEYVPSANPVVQTCPNDDDQCLIIDDDVARVTKYQCTASFFPSSNLSQ